MRLLRSVSLRVTTVLFCLAATEVALAAGGLVSLDGAALRALESDPKNCWLAHPAQSNAASYRLLLGPRNSNPWSLAMDWRVDDDPGNDSLQYGVGDEVWFPVSERARLEMAAEHAWESGEISGEDYYAKLDAAELANDRPMSGLNVVLTVAGEPWAAYVAARRAAERFPALKTETVSVRFAPFAVVTADEPAIKTLAIEYDGPCKLALESE